MKKILIICIVGCVCAASAFAQLNVGGYVQSYWTPYRLTLPEEGDTRHTTAVQTPWGEPDISAGVNFDGWSEWGGFHLGVGLANGKSNRSAYSFSATGGGWVWVKPFDFAPVVGLDTFTIYLGNPDNSQLMGKIGGSNLSTYVLNNSYAVNRIQGDNTEREFRLEVQNPEYNTFTRFNPYAWGNANANTQNLWWPRVAGAAFITWEPIEHLFIGFFVAPEMFDLVGWVQDAVGVSIADQTSINGDPISDDDINQDFYDVKQVYRKMQVGAGYNIPGVGYARLQFVGLRNVIEAAFQVTALGDVALDIGFKLPFEGTNKDDTSTYKKKRDFVASVAATYRNYDFRLLGRVDAAFAGSDSSGSAILMRGLNLIAYLVPSYQLNVGVVGLDLGFELEQKDDFNSMAADSMMAGIGAWFSRSMGNANFKVAAISRLPLEWNGMKQPFELFFPIRLEVGF